MPRGVRLFFVSESLYGLAIGLYTLVLNLHLLSRGLSEQQLGSILSIGILIMGGTAVPVSRLANRFGRKIILVTGISCTAMGSLMYGIGQSFNVFLAAQAMMSLGFTLVESSEVQLLFGYCKDKREETRSFNGMVATYTLFTAIGILAGGILPEWLSGSADSYGSTLVAAACLLAVLAVFRAVWLPKEQIAVTQMVLLDATGTAEVGNSHGDSHRLRVLIGFAFISGLAISVIVPYVNIIVKFRMDWSDQQVSYLLGASNLVICMVSLVVPILLHKYAAHKLFLWGYIANIVVSCMLVIALPAIAFVLMMLARGGLFALLNSMIDSQSMSAIGENGRNTYAGSRIVSRSVGSAISVFGAGLILAGSHYELPFLLAAVLMTVSFMYYNKWVKPIINSMHIKR